MSRAVMCPTLQTLRPLPSDMLGLKHVCVLRTRVLHRVPLVDRAPNLNTGFSSQVCWKCERNHIRKRWFRLELRTSIRFPMPLLVSYKNKKEQPHPFFDLIIQSVRSWMYKKKEKNQPRALRADQGKTAPQGLRRRLFISLFLSLVMSIFRPELPGILVRSLYVVDTNITQNFLQVSLGEKHTKMKNKKRLNTGLCGFNMSDCLLILPQAAWWYPPGLWCCSTDASQRQKTTCPKPAVCQLVLSCPPLSFSSRTQAAV